VGTTGWKRRRIHVQKEAHPQDQERHIRKEEEENPKKTTAERQKVSSSPITLYTCNRDYFVVHFSFQGRQKLQGSKKQKKKTAEESRQENERDIWKLRTQLLPRSKQSLLTQI